MKMDHSNWNCGMVYSYLNGSQSAHLCLYRRGLHCERNRNSLTVPGHRGDRRVDLGWNIQPQGKRKAIATREIDPESLRPQPVGEFIAPVRFFFDQGGLLVAVNPNLDNFRRAALPLRR